MSSFKESRCFIVDKIKRYFKFSDQKTIFKKEIIGGITTFLAMCYILAVNPSLVSNSLVDPVNSTQTVSNLTGGLFLVTAISSFFGTFLMGMWARIPVALAPGMGLNAFFTFNVASSVGFDSALSITILSGIFYFIIVCTPIRNKISKMIPTNFKIAIGCAIGFFIAFLGLENSGIIVKDLGSPLVSKIGNFTDPLVILAICLIALGLILHFAKVPGAMIITMIVGAIILIILCTTKVVVPLNSSGEALPNFGLLGSYDDFSTIKDVVKAGWLGFANVNMWTNPMTYIGLLSFLYMDFFDTTGSLIVIDKMVDLNKTDKNWISKANKVDAISTFVGAGIGATTVTTFVESTTGIGAGAKTGFASIITALCFGLSIALWPIMQVFMPINGLQPITSCALIIIGCVMMSQIRNFEWEIFVDIPMLFITIIFMTLTNSIAHGLSFGMLTYVIMNLSLGIIQKIKNSKKIINDTTIPITDKGVEVKTREFNYLKRLNWTCYTIAIISLIYIVFEAGLTYGNWF